MRPHPQPAVAPPPRHRPRRPRSPASNPRPAGHVRAVDGDAFARLRSQSARAHRTRRIDTPIHTREIIKRMIFKRTPSVSRVVSRCLASSRPRRRSRRVPKTIHSRQSPIETHVTPPCDTFYPRALFLVSHSSLRVERRASRPRAPPRASLARAGTPHRRAPRPARNTKSRARCIPHTSRGAAAPRAHPRNVRARPRAYSPRARSDARETRGTSGPRCHRPPARVGPTPGAAVCRRAGAREWEIGWGESHIDESQTVNVRRPRRLTCGVTFRVFVW